MTRKKGKVLTINIFLQLNQTCKIYLKISLMWTALSKALEAKNMPFCCFQFQQYQAITFFFLKKDPQIYTNKNHYEEIWGLEGEATKFHVQRKPGNHAEILTSMNFFSQNTHIAFFFKKKKNSVSSITQNKYKFTSRATEYFIWGKRRSLSTRSLDLLTASDCPF